VRQPVYDAGEAWVADLAQRRAALNFDFANPVPTAYAPAPLNAPEALEVARWDAVGNQDGGKALGNADFNAGDSKLNGVVADAFALKTEVIGEHQVPGALVDQRITTLPGVVVTAPRMTPVEMAAFDAQQATENWMNHSGLVGSAELALAGGSRIVAGLGGGLTYLGTLGMSGDPEAAAYVKAQTEDTLSYRLRSDGGKQVASTLATALAPTATAIADGYGNFKQGLGNYGYAVGGPFMGAVAATVPDVALNFLRPAKALEGTIGEVANSEWIRPSGWKLPVSNGEWTGAVGDSAWLSTKPAVTAITGGKPVPFVHGYPDFSEWSQGTFKIDNMTGTKSDFGMIYKTIADEFRLSTSTEAKNLLRELNLSPHHLPDGKTIQLVPTPLNQIPHVGGAARLRNGG